MSVSTLSEAQLYRFLLDQGFSEQVATVFQENDINGAVFCQMTDEHLKELAPRIVDRVKLKALQDSQPAPEKVILTSFNLQVAKLVTQI